MKFIAQECLERIKQPKGVCNDRMRIINTATRLNSFMISTT